MVSSKEPGLIKSGKSKEKLDAEDIKNLDEKVLESEKLLIGAVRLLLREYGVRKSAAAVRDAVDHPHDNFKPQNAVSALSNLGFKSSFGYENQN